MSARAQATRSQEDYLEAILELVESGGKARVVDIAKAVGVGKSATSLAVKALCEKGLALHDNYGAVGLTAEGKAMAERVRSNHRAIREFLTDQLRLPPEIADRDACAMEHVVSPELVDRFVRFLEFSANCPLGRAKWDDELGFFCAGKRGCSDDGTEHS